MKGSDIVKTLKFSYYDEFACTGPECEDSCCKHWGIDLSKREYLDYKKMECSPELKAVINSAFKRKRDGNDLQYAKMNLKEDGSCPFLGEDRLCMLQKEKGESALTVVCSSFPRNWIQVGTDAVVFVLVPTCYHVVELLMQYPEGIVLIEEEYDNTNKWINQNRYTGIGLSPDSKMIQYIWTIKTAQLDILQNREFTIAERLLILGYYTKKACEHLEMSPKGLKPLGGMMLDKELCRQIADSLKTPQTEVQAASKSANILFNTMSYMRNNIPKSHLTELLGIMADSIELKYEPLDTDRYTVRYSSSAYLKNREAFAKIEEERPYILENLFASLTFAMFSQDENELWADYFSLAVLYNFLKIGLAAFLPENYGDKEIAMAITNMVKILMNSKMAKRLIMKEFTRNDTNSLPYVAFLIS